MARGHGWRRIAQVYALVEQMRSAELGLAHGAVLEAERALSFESEVCARKGGAGRGALMLGDRSAWALAEAQRGAALIRMQRLGQIRAEREVLREHAAETHRKSRLDEQQVECAIERARQQERREEERRLQAVADDRYLARREWMRMQGEGAARDAGCADEKRLM